MLMITWSSAPSFVARQGVLLDAPAGRDIVLSTVLLRLAKLAQVVSANVTPNVSPGSHRVPPGQELP